MNHPSDENPLASGDDTASAVETGGPGPAWGDWSRPGHRARVAALVFVVLVAVTGFVVRPPVVVMTPGRATPVNPAISVSGAETYANPGRVLYLSVFLSNRRPTLYELAAVALDDDAELIDEKKIYGPLTRKQSDQVDEILMRESQANAKKAALERLGYQVPFTGEGFSVVEVEPTGPSADRLQRSDVVTAVNGEAVDTREAFVARVRAVPPGSTLTLAVSRGGSTQDVPVTTAANEEGQSIIGVRGYTAQPRYIYPFDVAIDSGDTGGPSAGLAFALGIIDELTPGDLTGGARVAVTGTIGPDGRVGPIGGVRQKAIAAHHAGAALLLVPASEVGEARAAGMDVPIVGVDTLDDALSALAAVGGTPLPAR